MSRDDYLADILDAVRESVNAHMVADVPVGLFLSAGIDSNLIARFARESTPEKICATTLAFYEYANTPFDESPVASLAAHQFGLDHTIRYVDRIEFGSQREAIFKAMDQPTTDGINSYFVSMVTAESGIKVALSGLGGDEILAGYPGFEQIPKLVRRVSALPSSIRAMGRLGRKILTPFLMERYVSPKYAGILEYGGDWSGAYMLRRSLHMPWEIPGDFTTREIDEAVVQILDAQKHEHDLIRRIDSPQLKISAFELTEYLRNQLVRDTDWAAMSHSLEVRVPLLDVRLLASVAEAVATVPGVTKTAVARHTNAQLPAAIWNRPKSGFAVPVREWLVDSGQRRRGLRSWSHEVAHRFKFPSLRILALVTDAYGGVGGIAKFNRDLLNSISDDQRCRSVDVVPRLIRGTPGLLPQNLRFHVDATRGKAAYLAAAARLIIDRRQFNWIVCGHINLVPLAWVLRLLTRSPITLIVHGIDAWAPHPNSIVRFLLRRIDKIVAVSNFTAEKMHAWSHVPLERFDICPNCVELERYAPRPPAPYLLARYGLLNKTIIMTTGRLVSMERYKGFDEVLEAMPALRKKYPDLHYLIIGDGDDVNRLKEKAIALGLGNCVTFTGYIAEEEKADHYSLARAYVMPSRGEGFGIVYLEALASGIPVMGSKVDGSRDALMGGKIGLLVDPGCPNEIIEGIATVLERPTGNVPAELGQYSFPAFRDRIQRRLIEPLVR